MKKIPINQNPGHLPEVRSVGVQFSFYLKKKKKKKLTEGWEKLKSAICVHQNMFVRVCSDSETLLAEIRGPPLRWNETTL